MERADAMTAERMATEPADARLRIVAAGIRCIIRDGIAETTMASIAEEGEVSKALLHYHFTDRAHLLAEIVIAVGRRIVAREHAAATRREQSAMDALWGLVVVELTRGELHALLAAATIENEPVRRALAEVHQQRREAARRTIEGLFERLALAARVPSPLIADTWLAFLDGLALGRREPEAARTRFDVFWLAMLSLGE